VSEARADSPATTRRRRGPAAFAGRLGITERGVIFVVLTTLYITAGAIMVFGFNSIPNDTIARTGNGYYVLFSRDPHLAAIGFVWNPLPSMSVMPLLPFGTFWPALVDRAFAANIVSALCMAGSVVVFRGVLADWGVGRGRRLALCALYGLNPMVFYYGANGMSEGLFFLTLMLTVRHLSRWLGDNRPESLIKTGIYLALAYLTRSEALAGMISVIALVAVLSTIRAPGGWRHRRSVGLNDAVLVGFAPVLAFAFWALTSWIIVGHPFEQFSSVYGTASQLKALELDPTQGRSSALAYVGEQVIGLAPVLPVALVLATLCVVFRRDLRAIAPVALFGSALTFGVVFAASGKTAGFLRYFIAAIPLTALLVGFVAATGRSPRRWRRLASASVAGLAAMAMLVVTAAGSWVTMFDRSLGREESYQLSQVVPDLPYAEEFRKIRWRFVTEREIARYLDDMHLDKGSVVVDVAFAHAIVMGSRRPDQFVITTDSDFQQRLRAPGQFGVEYAIVQPGSGLGSLDAVNREFPTINDENSSVATLVKEFTNVGDGPNWRLYRFNPDVVGQPG
jgi:hypothetical protein